HGRSSDIGEFFNGLRRYFFKSWLWMLPNLILVFLLPLGLRFYGKLGSEIGFLLQIVVVVIVITWISLQFYALPYLFEHHENVLMRAWRNALFTALASPVYTVSVLAIAALLVAVNVATVAPLFLGGTSLLVLFSTHAVFNRLETFKVRERDTQR